MTKPMRESEMRVKHRASAPDASGEPDSRQASLVESAMSRYTGAKQPIGRGAVTHDASKEALASVSRRGERLGVVDIGLESQHYDAALSVAIYRPLADLARHYEALRAALWLRDPENALQVVLFVSPTSGSGVSTTAFHYAAMLAREAGVKVLLIDANLRDVGQRICATQEGEHDAHGVSLAGLLTETACPIHPLPGPTNLYVLPSGTDCGMPLGLFQSSAFDQLLQTVRERFQYVVVDAPAIQGHPETLVLSRKADGVVLVIEAERTRKNTARWAKQQIEDAGGRLLGVVLNKRKQHIPGWLYRRLFA